MLKQTKARRKGAEHMKIVGCDLHTRYQQIAMLDQETGELIERRLEHESGEARAFYASLEGPVRVGIEATGHTRWFERMLAELDRELWIGDAAEIRASRVRKQKTDARDAAQTRIGFGLAARLICENPGRGASQVPLRRSWICRHAPSIFICSSRSPLIRKVRV
jgi:transposase